MRQGPVRRQLILLLLFGLCALSVGGTVPELSKPQLNFERIGLTEGLSQSTIKHLFQDQAGYLWVSTDDGLNRYDGYGFKKYRHVPFTENTLASSRIVRVFQEKKGQIWVITASGICLLQPDGETFLRLKESENQFDNAEFANFQDMKEDTSGRIWLWGRGQGGFLVSRKEGSFEVHFSGRTQPLQVRDMAEDQEGGVWFTTKTHGLMRYTPETNSFKRMTAQDLGLDPQTNMQGPLLRDDFGFLWFPTPLGIVRFDPKKETAEVFAIPIAFQETDDLRATWLQDTLGYFWLLDRFYLTRFDPATRECKVYQHDPDNPYSLPQAAMTMTESQSGVLWLVTQGQGICRLDRTTDRFLSSRFDPHNPQSPASNFLTTVFEDRSGTLWFGGFDSGLTKYSPQKEKFRHYLHSYGQPRPIRDAMVWSLLVDQEGYTWVGTSRDGLLKVNKDRSEIMAQYEPKSRINGLFQDREGTIWLNNQENNNALMKSLDPQTGAVTTRSALPMLSAVELPNGEGFIFGAGPKGIGQYTYADRTCRKLATNNAEPWRNVRSVLVLHDGRYFASNTFSIVIYDPKTQMTTVFEHDPNNPRGLGLATVLGAYQSADGMVWIGLHGGGLDRFDPVSGTFKNYTSRNGLANDVVYNILGDSNGDLWMSTNGGLSRFNPSTEVFRNFDTFDGLQSLEFNFGAVAIAPDGELLAGGVNGFNAFYPREIYTNPSPPPLTLSAYLEGRRKPLGSFTSGSQIELEPSDHMISFSYAGLDYVEPRKNSYAYRLEGFEADWQYVGQSRWATYTNLSKGDYTFHLKAANSDGIWSATPLSVNIHVKPHYYETLIFKLCVTLVCLWGLVWFFLRQRHISKRRQEEALLLRDHLRKSEELEFARSLQLAMLPKKDFRAGRVEILGEMITATEVGGDYFDFFQLDERRIGVAYGDATGHGVAAGLIVGMVKMAATIWSLNPKSLEDMVSDLNQGLRRTLPLKTMGMGFGLAIYDQQTHEVELCSSGMPFPYHYQALTGQLRPIELKGPPLGYLKRLQPKAQRLWLAEGDFLIFLSDGFSERFNEESQMWGCQALVACLRMACRQNKGPEDIARQLIADCNAFAGARPCDDDMTVVIIHRHMEPQPVASRVTLQEPSHV